MIQNNTASKDSGVQSNSSSAAAVAQCNASFGELHAECAIEVVQLVEPTAESPKFLLAESSISPFVAVSEDVESEEVSSDLDTPIYFSDNDSSSIASSRNSPISSPQSLSGDSITSETKTLVSLSPKDRSPSLSKFSFVPLSPEELDEAKSEVLDLLGWGVDAEYLITFGVSPVVLFRIFTDLNLRLPKNIELCDELIILAYSWALPPEVAD